MFDMAQQATQEHFHRRIRLFAPIYFSNYCINRCRYCAFRADNATLARRWLSLKQLQSEACAVAAMGHRTVLLVAGEHPKLAGAAATLQAVESVSSVSQIDEVRLEVMPLTVEGYQRLAQAGVQQVLVYQETYDRTVYARAHPAGPKADYAWRRGAAGRVLRAGIPRIGLGILLGLADAAADAAALIGHARALFEEFGIWPSVSLPRIQPADKAPWSVHPPAAVDDRAFLRLIALIRVALPQSEILLSTREHPALRNQALTLGIGVTQMSAGSRTEVGGYAANPGVGQFEINDRRTVEEVVRSLTRLGYTPVWSEDVSRN